MKLSSSDEFSQNLKWNEDGSSSATSWYVQPQLAPYITFWCGLLLYPFQRQMREARQMDKADIVPTPYFLSAFFWGLGEHKINTMKKIAILLMAMVVAVSCSTFDDSEIWDKLKEHEDRIVYLENLCEKMNSNILSLQTVLDALEKNDYITNASPLADGSGYVLIFKSGKSVIVYHGKDGKDGVDGANGKDGVDGKDGADGADGKNPTIGVMKDIDGIYYWTLNGEWLLVNGQKVKASAVDGITPKFKIENGYWYISYDNEVTWEKLGKATGSNGLDGVNGSDGDSMFKRVYVEDGYVCFEMNDGKDTIIRIPLMKDGSLIINVEKEGTLSRILTSEQTRTTTNLILKGTINIEDMKHIQIMQSLQKLDLSAINYVYNSKIEHDFAVNPYRDTLLNKTLEEVVLPKGIKYSEYQYEASTDISFCLALKKVTITDNDEFFSSVNKNSGLGYAAEMKLFPSLQIVEYAEGVESTSYYSGWENLQYRLEKIIYPSTLLHIPSTLTISTGQVEETLSGYKNAYTRTIPCKNLICKAITPPIAEGESSTLYDSINHGYYSVDSSTKTKRIWRIKVPDDAVLYVPKESIELYRSAPLWDAFKNIKAIEEM